MQNQLNELKRKMLEFFQQKQKNKKSARPWQERFKYQKI
ncbi:penicillin-binding protein 1B [Streptococcus pneumoniae]|nr:penicillin-binding protein 1B [Streptococcus pneumoniae]